MASQLYGVTGRKIPSSTVAVINSQSAYLPQMKKQEADDAYRMKTLDLQEKQLTQEGELGQEALDVQKRQNRVANMLGVGNLGLKAGLGLYADKGTDTAKNLATSATVKPTTEMGSYLFGGTSTGSPATTAGTSIMDKLTDMGAWGGAATSFEPWAGAAGGTLASRLLTKKDDSMLKKGLIGAGAGAGISAITSGGDIYKTVLGGVLGGAGGLF